MARSLGSKPVNEQQLERQLVPTPVARSNWLYDRVADEAA